MRKVWCCLLLLLPFLAVAEETGHSKLTRLSTSIRVADDFSYTQEVETEYKALTEQGARADGRYPITHDSFLIELEILGAETLKADGRRIPVPPSGIIRQRGSAGLYSRADLEFTILALPDFAAGDSARIHYRLHAKPLLPGSFAIAFRPLPVVRQDLIEWRLDVPAGMRLQIDDKGLTRTRDEVSGGRRLLAWQHSVAAVREAEPMQTEARLSEPHLAISSFASWDAMSATYLPLYRPQSAGNPEIAALAQELTAGADGEREKARRLYDWVRKNIRYVAIYAGLETWVPHPAGQVLANRFGDCKDHAVLLDALLKAAGIDSSPVMIQSDLASYRLPEVAVPQASFNHMISYLPSLDLYLDSTSAPTEFGRLPDGDQGKQVLRIGQTPLIGQTPVSKASERRSVRKTSIRIKEDGSATISTSLRFGGDYRTWFEQFRQERQNGKEGAWATAQLIAQKKRGTASLKWLGETRGQLGLGISQNIENYLGDGEIGLLDFGHAYVGGASILPLLDLYERRARSSSFSCLPIELEDEVDISLPATLRVLRVPRNQSIESEVASLRVEYTQKDDRVAMKRSFRFEPGRSGSCEAGDWNAWQQSMRQMRSAVNSAQLPYERL